MEIKINKEVREYSEKILFGLSARQFILALAAIAVSLVLYFTLPFQTDVKLTFCLVATSPFIVFGFMTVQGHSLEEYLKRMKDRLQTPELKLGEENIYYRIYRRHKYEQHMLDAQRGKHLKLKNIPGEKDESINTI
jgi:hypothetical protein